MIKEFTIEQLDAVLDYPTIERLETPNPSEYFDRARHIRVLGKEYDIAWYVNIVYVFIGDVQLVGRYLKRTNTWPVHTKMQLQLIGNDDQVVAIIPIEYYDKQ